MKVIASHAGCAIIEFLNLIEEESMQPDIQRLIAKELVAETVPEELEFFDEIADSIGKETEEHDSLLGFGGGDAGMVVVTTFLLGVGRELTEFIWENGKDATGQLVRDASQSIRMALQKKLDEWLKMKAKGKAPIVVSSTKTKVFTDRIEGAGIREKIPVQHVLQIRQWISDKFGEG